MTNTRQSTDLIALIDKKFDEFKISLLNDLKSEFTKFVGEQKEEIANYIDEKKTGFVENTELSHSVAILQEHVNKLKQQNEQLLNKVDSLEQYQRRVCIRIYGVPTVRNETSDDVQEKVMAMVDGAKMDIPAHAIDRAHRIGLKKQVEGGVELQPIIVRFNNFTYRTRFYKARKDIVEKVGVSLDLTKTRLALLKMARDFVKEIEGIKFVYTDINCRLRAFTEAGQHIAFDSMTDLEEIIKRL